MIKSSNQPNGEVGILLTNGYVNIFYVRLKDDRVVAVGVSWSAEGAGWDLDAYALHDRAWVGGSCVFSRG